MQKAGTFCEGPKGRVSFSVPLNIAEGSGKFSKPDRKNYFITARASIFESIAMLDILLNEKIITKEEFDSFGSLAHELYRMLYKMIENLT